MSARILTKRFKKPCVYKNFLPIETARIFMREKCIHTHMHSAYSYEIMHKLLELSPNLLNLSRVSNPPKTGFN